MSAAKSHRMTAKKKRAKKSAKKATKKKALPVRRSNARAPQAARAKSPLGYTASATIAADAGATVKQRLAALQGLGATLCDDPATFRHVLNTLKDTATPSQVRLAALATLQAATFNVIKFNACRPEYMAALRSLAADPDLELRQRTLGILAREGDGYVQELLLEGLRDPGRALVPPEKALQLLSYDIHADTYQVARQIVERPPTRAARREALRVLAADATSAPVFEKLLRDKSEQTDIRQVSASALQSVAPQSFQSAARDIVLDKSDNSAVQTTSLTALTLLARPEDVSGDDALYARANELKAKKTASPAIKKVAQRFLKKYSR